MNTQEPKKQPIYNVEGYPSNTVDTIFKLYMDAVRIVMPRRRQDILTKQRILRQCRKSLHICLN